MEKKSFVLGLVILLMIIASLALISSKVEITKTAVSNLAIKDLNKPAIFNFDIKNLGETDNFNIYTTVGLTLEPNETFTINSGEIKTIQIKIYPTIPLRASPDYYSFEYKIKGEKTAIQKEDLAITLAYLEDAFDFSIDPINPDSDTAKVHFNNKYGGEINDIHLELSASFFSESVDFSLASLEKKEINVKLNRDKMKELLAGPYIVNGKLKVREVSTDISTILKFEEKSGIETTQLNEGWFLQREEVDKYNKGNIKTETNVVISKNLIAALFTTIDPDPSSKEISGFRMNYIYDKQLSPGESLKVIAKTNWWILILIIVVILIIWYVLDKYIKNKIVISKRVSFVRTRGGEFALKVTLKVKARDFVERVRLLDRLPPMVKIFDGYGSSPEKIDQNNRRLEWNIQALGKGEERIFNYIIYSKIGMVGKFELPRAMAIYEFEGKLKEAQSNEAFYLNEPVKLD